MSLKLVTGAIAHESNTFSNAPTGRAEFEQRGLYLGEDIRRAFAGTGSVMGGFIAAAQAEGFELIPTVSAHAMPMGRVTAEAFNYLEDRLLDGIKQARSAGCDGVLLELHGAMVVEGIEDGEGRILEDVRALVGPDVPIVSTLDLHANLTEQMVSHANALVGYDTYPHVDQFECAQRAARLIVAVLRDGLRPTMALNKPPLLPPLQTQVTSRPTPMRKLVARTKAVEKEPGMVSASAFAGFPFADIAAAGLGILAVADNDPALAARKAQELADYAWSLRHEFPVQLMPPDEAIRRAMAADGGTFILADVADSGAGGSAGDGTVILEALLRLGARDAAVAQIADEEAVNQAITAGVGSTVSLVVGGKHDRLHGDPVAVTGKVRLISDGTYVRKGPQQAGVTEHMGPTVVLEIGGRHGVDLILTAHRAHPSDLQHFRSLGIEPTEKRILVLKSAAHYRAAFEPIAREVFEVDAPGICHPDLARLQYQHLRRPIFPLDEL